jgi:hypothetical protein
MTTPSLLDILQSTDMLEINGLHAWEFVLAPQALVAAHAALAAGQGGDAEQLLQIECMDGRTRRVWKFSSAAVLAATFDDGSQCWSLNDADGVQQLNCLSAISASADDELDDEPAANA